MMDGPDNISQMLDNLENRIGRLREDSITRANVTTWSSKLFNVQRTLKCLQNMLAPVNQLPPEMLCRIFSAVLDSCRSSDSDFDHPLQTQSILDLTAVCQKWRHTALDNALFWNDINIDYASPSSFPRASEFLIRSKGAPLNVVMTGTASMNCDPREPLNHWMVKLAEEGHRLERFTVSGNEYGIFDLMRFAAPNLVSLDVSCWSSDIKSVHLPPIFNNHFPGLRKFTLEYFNPSPSFFTDLTHIDIRGIAPSGMSGSEFLDLLQRSPALIVLKMVNQCSEEKDVSQGRVIHLPNLRIMDIADCNTSFILSHIIPSQSCEITLNNALTYHMRTIDSSDMHILTALPPAATDVYLPIKTKSFVIRIDDEGFRVNARHQEGMLSIHQSLGFFVYQGQNVAPFIQRSLVAIANYQPLTSISELAIIDDHRLHRYRYGVYDFPNFSAPIWDMWFSQLKSLERIKLRLVSLNDIFDSLIKRTPQDGFLCPNLRYLELEISSKDTLLTDVFLQLTDLVMQRHAWKLPLVELKVTVDKPPMTDGWEERWRTYVDEAHLIVSQDVEFSPEPF